MMADKMLQIKSPENEWHFKFSLITRPSVPKPNCVSARLFLEHILIFLCNLLLAFYFLSFQMTPFIECFQKKNPLNWLKHDEKSSRATLLPKGVLRHLISLFKKMCRSVLLSNFELDCKAKIEEKKRSHHSIFSTFRGQRLITFC